MQSVESNRNLFCWCSVDSVAITISPGIDSSLEKKYQWGYYFEDFKHCISTHQFYA